MSELQIKNIGDTDWLFLPLSYVAGVSLGKTPRKIDYTNSGKYKILKFRDLGQNTIDWKNADKGFVDANLAPFNGMRSLSIDDVLVTSSAHSSEHIGKKIALVKHLPDAFLEHFYVGELLCIRSNNVFLAPKFVMYYLMSTEGYKEIQDKVKGVHLTSGEASKLNIPLPSLAEQKRIVEKIEALFSRLDAGIAALEKTKAQLKRYKQTVLISHFKALKNTANATTSIGELFKVETGGTPKRGVAKYWVNGTVPWITSTAVNKEKITDYQELITENAVRETNAKIYPKGSLIIAMYGEGKTRGMVSELCIEASSNQACAAIIFNKENEYYKEYIRFFLLMSYEETRRGSSGGVQPNLNLSKVRNIEFPPVTEKQAQSVIKEIEKAFSVADKALEAVEQELKKAQALKSKILEYAFTGKLVPQNPDDEPAEKLLERIKAEKEASRPTKKTIKRK